MRRLIRLGIPGVIAGGVTQLNIVIGTVVASLQDGAVSHLYYADRVYELPLAIVGIAIGVVLLPDVSRHLRAGNHAAVMDSQNRSLEFAMLLTVPAAVALAVVPTEIVSGLFERGAFTAGRYAAPRPMRWRIFALGLPSFVLIKVFSPAYFAREDTATPMRYAAISLTANTLGSVGAVLPLPRHGADAASRHRRGDDAGRLAQRRPALPHAGQARRISWATRGCSARLPLHRAGDRSSWVRALDGCRGARALVRATAAAAVVRAGALTGAGRRRPPRLRHRHPLLRGARPAPAAQSAAAQSPSATRPERTASMRRPLPAPRRHAITRADHPRTPMQLPQKPTPRVFSGMQPTGNLHLGNYLGAMVQLGRDAEEPRVHLLRGRHARHHHVAGPQELKSATRAVTAAYMAAGLDPKKSILFNQSQVHEHAELAWVFNCVARLGWLNRMTQFKEKAGKDRENASVGLYAYPVLMAADILAYRATHVPVGDDQKQHLELARDIAQKFNNDFGDSIRERRVRGRHLLPAARAGDHGAGDARHEPARRHQEDVEVGPLRHVAHQHDRRCRHHRQEDPEGQDRSRIRFRQRRAGLESAPRPTISSASTRRSPTRRRPMCSASSAAASSRPSRSRWPSWPSRASAPSMRR